MEMPKNQLLPRQCHLSFIATKNIKHSLTKVNIEQAKAYFQKILYFWTFCKQDVNTVQK